MERFRSGHPDVLVATTVIEVGVDVPNATVMVLLDADRFGLLSSTSCAFDVLAREETKRGRPHQPSGRCTHS